MKIFILLLLSALILFAPIIFVHILHALDSEPRKDILSAAYIFIVISLTVIVVLIAHTL